MPTVRPGSVRRRPSHAVRSGGFAAAPSAHHHDHGDRLRARIERELLAGSTPMYAADPEGNLLFANAAYKRLLQAETEPPNAAPDMPGQRLASPGILSTVKRGMDAVDIDESFTVGRTTRRFHSHHVPITDDQGNLLAVSGVYHDVTREHALSERAERIRDRFDDIARLVSDWVWEVDRDFNLTLLSARVMEVFGTYPRLLLGSNLFELGAFTEAGDDTPDRNRRTPFRDKVFRVVGEDGQARLCRLGGVPTFDSQTGQFTGFRGIGRDITAATEIEKRAAGAHNRLAEAIEGSSEAFALFDANDRLVASNRKFRENYASIAELVTPGVTFEELVRAGAERGVFADAVGRIDEWVASELERLRNPRGAREKRLADGRWLNISDRRMADGSLICVGTDITEIKQREEALRRSEEESRAACAAAELANRNRAEFFANLSHELRTPLNAIIGFSQVLMTETFGRLESPKYREYIKDIHDSGTYLGKLVNDIGDAAKTEAGKLELSEGVVDVADVLTRCMRLISARAERARVELAAELPRRLPKLFADERKIQQIFLNLLSNAVKFTPDGGTVTTTARIDTDGWFRIEVADCGIGIAEKDVPIALAPYGRLDNKLARHDDGRGLGLPLTKALVELHGGAFDLKSEVNVGTTVTVRLPEHRVRHG